MLEDSPGDGFRPPRWIESDFDLWWIGMAWDGHRAEVPKRVGVKAGKRNREADELAEDEAATQAMAEADT
jgi:hypothetical protein